MYPAVSETLNEEFPTPKGEDNTLAYVKNEDRAHTGNVSGMLLYARTTEEIEPWLSVPIGGNQISVRSLDLNRPFVEIADSLDRIAYENFGDTLKRIA